MTDTNEVTRKLFVLDTNVILHDSQCIYKFNEHDIVIPIQCIEELDTFKKGLETINFHARDFCRILDELSSDHIFNGGISLGNGLGNLRIALAKNWDEKVKSNLRNQTVDAEIINLAYLLKIEHPDTQVVIVSKDVNLRMKAKALGVLAQDFLYETVINTDILTRKVEIIEDVEPETINSLYSNKNKKVEYLIPNAMPNQNYILMGANKTAMVVYKDNSVRVISKDKQNAFSVHAKNSEQAFGIDALFDPEISLVTIEGKAGTGKTIVSIASALQQLYENTYDKIFFSRQTISVGNREIGFLPGDAKDKISPFMNGMYDNLDYIKSLSKNNDERIKSYVENEKLLIEPLAFIRGRSLNKVFFILDEAQNLTPHEVKTIVTRAGEGTKIVLIGDTRQIDHPYLDQRSNGFSYLIQKFQGQYCYSHIHLIKSERSPLAGLAGELL